ncbi:MAG: tRNA (adenosine(37)-N6)-threonylcarbamoyltransferase complex ATPase subunit type 1 TsaE [Calditrichaeota bacterium]|nr:MAG: tRNA (adenosine(37)-N6)-threonylcarbamoyltransferase complex ATPase subunit type 1 TsaE [Calditrichota bacterium]
MNFLIPESIANQLEITSSSAEETFAFGKSLSQTLSLGDVVCLHGDLGAGKTVCIKGVCAGLGVSEHVTSPTFTLINEYRGALPVYHFDFYRIADEHEVFELGLPEYLNGDGICLIEWPDRISPLLPGKRIEIRIAWDDSFDPSTRLITIYRTQ